MTTESINEFENMEMSALISAGDYNSKEEVRKDALRCLLEHRPELKLKVAMELYRKEEISLEKASEISGLNFFEFKELMVSKGMLKIPKLNKNNIEKGVKIVNSLRKK